MIWLLKSGSAMAFSLRTGWSSEPIQSVRGAIGGVRASVSEG
jgi:hypothetical protein